MGGNFVRLVGTLGLALRATCAAISPGVEFFLVVLKRGGTGLNVINLRGRIYSGKGEGFFLVTRGAQF